MTNVWIIKIKKKISSWCSLKYIKSNLRNEVKIIGFISLLLRVSQFFLRNNQSWKDLQHSLNWPRPDLPLWLNLLSSEYRIHLLRWHSNLRSRNENYRVTQQTFPHRSELPPHSREVYANLTNGTSVYGALDGLWLLRMVCAIRHPPRPPSPLSPASTVKHLCQVPFKGKEILTRTQRKLRPHFSSSEGRYFKST